MFKKSKHIVIIIIVCTICIIAALLCTVWLSFRRNNPNRSLYGRNVTLSGEMSTQERADDFDELCGFLEANAPIIGKFGELYGISYQSVKEHYGRRVQNAENDFAYYACLTGFLNNIPSAHMKTGFPGGRLADGNMERWLSANQSFADAQSYWLEILHSECLKHYDGTGEKAVFSYYSGSYVGVSLTEGDRLEINRAVLLSINGVPADDFIKLFSSSYKLKYDHAAGKPFRDSIIFNGSFGEPCEIEYLTADGATRTAELYCGAESEICLNYAEYFKAIDGTVQPQNGEASARGGNVLSVLRDEENSLAVIFLDSFDSETVTGEVIANTIKKISAEFDTIVIDIRNNSGGYYEYAYDVLSALTAEDIEISNSIFCTEESFGRNGDIFSFKRTKDGFWSSTEKRTVKGEAAGDKDLYLLVSDKTASAADLLASEFKRNGLGTVAGVNNTDGEKNGTVRLGFCTGSGIYFYYTEYSSPNPDGTDNGVYGTAPDILLEADPESYFTRERLRESGADIYSPENRLEWDGVLRQVFELIGEQN